MILHFLFILFYYAFGTGYTPQQLLYISIGQTAASLLLSLTKDKKFVNPYNVNHIALLLVNFGNLSLLDRIARGENYMYWFASVEHMQTATLIWCVGNSAFLLGYQLFKSFSLPTIGIKLGQGHMQSLFYITVVLSIFSKYITKLFFLPGAFAKILSLSGLLGILFFARIWAKENDKTARNNVIVLFVIQQFNALFFSYLRFEILMPIIVFYSGYLAGKESVRYIFSYRVLPFIAVMVLFLNAFSQLGDSRANFALGFYNVYVAPDEETVEDEMGTSDVYEFAVDRGGMLDRSATLAQVSCCVDLVNKNGYYGGSVSAPIITALIPRFLWPEKPKIAIGQWFALASGAGYSANGKTVNNSVNITIPGELYIDFGWIGVVIGCLLFGGLIVMTWNASQFNESAYNFTGAVLGGYMIFYALTGISIDLQIVINYLSFYLIFVVIKRIVCAYYV